MQAPPLFHLAFMTQHTLSFKRPLSDASRMRQILEDYGWDFRTIAHSVWQAKGDAGVVTFYQSGKLVIQTPTPDLLTEMLTLGDDVPANHTKPASPSTARAGSTHDAQARLATFEQWRTGFGAPQITEWIGIDEAGKGDFFGPLITAAVRVEHKDLPWLAELGVGDSKQIHDKNIRPIAAQLKQAFKGKYSVIVLMPPKYNELYGKFKNLNRLLAWMHATSAEDILKQQSAQLILSDQFSKRAIVPDFFKGPGKNCRYVQQTRAESDAAVGCASILARAEFLWRMDELESKYGLTLHKGAGTPTIRDATRFVARYGVDELHHVAKTHFKTMERFS